jgi:hypothetical protein
MHKCRDKVVSVNPLVETRIAEPNSRVVALASVRSLARFLEREFDALKGTAPYPGWTEFSVTCSDGSSYQSPSADLFEEESPIVRKRVRSISLALRHTDTNATVQITLRNGAESAIIEVRGSNTKWVNGVMKELEERFSAFPLQESILSRNRLMFRWLLAFSLGFSMWHLLDLFITPTASTAPPAGWFVALSQIPGALHVLTYGWLTLAMYPLAGLVLTTALKLWPSIEIQIGPDHTFVEKRRRRAIALVFTVVLLPITSAAIYDLAKAKVIPIRADAP